MPNDAQFRTLLLRGRGVEALHQIERDQKYTTDQRAMIKDEIRGRHTHQDITGRVHDRPAPGSLVLDVSIRQCFAELSEAIVRPQPCRNEFAK